MNSISFLWKRTIVLDVIQGILIGVGLAFVTLLNLGYTLLVFYITTGAQNECDRLPERLGGYPG